MTHQPTPEPSHLMRSILSQSDMSIGIHYRIPTEIPELILKAIEVKEQRIELEGGRWEKVS